MAQLGAIALAGKWGAGLTAASTWGAWIGYAVGSSVLVGAAGLIDQKFLYPALSGKGRGNLAPNELLGVGETTANSGSPRLIALGRRVRVPVHIMFQSEKVRSTGNRSGKGGAQAHSHVRTVYNDIALALNNRLTRRLVSLLGNGGLFYWSDSRNLVRVADSAMAATTISTTLLKITAATTLGPDFTHRFDGDRKENGTATAGGSSTLTDGSQAWTVNQWADHIVTITAGTGAGQWRRIQSNTATALTVDTAWSTNPDATSTYDIAEPGSVVKLRGFSTHAIDGYWRVVSAKQHEFNGPSYLILRPQESQTPTAATAGTAFDPATVERVDDAIVEHALFVNGSIPNTRLQLSQHNATTIDIHAPFQVGDEVVLAGYTASGLNGKWRIAQKGFTSGGLQYVYLDPLESQTPASGTAGTATAAGTVKFTTSNQNFHHWMFESASSPVLWHPGDETQTEDSMLAQHLTSGEIPGFRGLSYVTMDGWNLTQFNNSVPLLEAIIEPDAAMTYPEAIAEALRIGGVDAAFIDVADVAAEPFEGYFWRGAQALSTILQPVLAARQILAQDRFGTLRFFDLAAADVVQIRHGADYSDMAATTEQNEDQPPFRCQLPDPTKLPTRVGVEFMDPDVAYGKGYQSFGLRSPSSGEPGTEQEIRMPTLAMSSQQARNLAATTLRRAWINAKAYELSLPASYLHVQENDCLTWTDDSGNTHFVRVIRADRGANFMQRISAVAELLDSEVAGSPVQGGATPPPIILTPPVLDAYVLDMLPLQDDHAYAPRLYFAAAANGGGRWAGVRIFESIDGGSSYEQVATIDTESQCGVADTALGDAASACETPGSAGVTVDNTNTVEITLHSAGLLGGMSSAAQAQVEQGLNWGLLGNDTDGYEMFGWTTVTQLGADSYELSGLLRGLRRSRFTDHAAGDRFLLVTAWQASYRSRQHDGNRQIGQTVHYKFVPIGATLNDVDAIEIDLAFNSCRPAAPFDLTINRDGSNNATLEVTPHTRLNYPIGDAGPYDFGEPFEAYEFRVFDDNTYTTQVATLTISSQGFASHLGSPRWVPYTAAQQTADGLTPGATLYVDVVQIGVYGAGQVLRSSG